MKHEPSGTNLFDAVQADAMVRYMVGGIPSETMSEKDLAHGPVKCSWCGGFVTDHEDVDAASERMKGNKREWWAAIEIERLRPVLEAAKEFVENIRANRKKHITEVNLIAAVDRAKGRTVPHHGSGPDNQ